MHIVDACIFGFSFHAQAGFLVSTLFSSVSLQLLAMCFLVWLTISSPPYSCAWRYEARAIWARFVKLWVYTVRFLLAFFVTVLLSFCCSVSLEKPRVNKIQCFCKHARELEVVRALQQPCFGLATWNSRSLTRETRPVLTQRLCWPLFIAFGDNSFDPQPTYKATAQWTY